MLTSATTLYLWRRSRIAEVKSKEVATADDMVNLINKVMERALAQMSKENEKLRKLVTRFERALQKTNLCPHRAICPVAEQLQSDTATHDNAPNSG